MNGWISPQFEHEHILRREMLMALYDSAHDYAVLMSAGLSDGILQGCRITAEPGRLIVERGLVHYGQAVWYLREPVMVPYEPAEVFYVVKLRFGEERRQDGCICREMAVVCAEGTDLADNELELCRFKLKAGSQLRSRYTDFADYNTEFDTVNRISVPFAGPGVSTLPPELLEAFALEALTCELESVDQSFVVRALDQAHVMSRQAVTAYLALRLKAPFRAYSSPELFDMMCSLLDRLRDGGERQLAVQRRRQRNILLD